MSQHENGGHHGDVGNPVSLGPSRLALGAGLVVALVAALVPLTLLAPAGAQVANPPLPISEVALDTWEVDGLNGFSVLPDWDVLVWDFAEINGVMYVGGRFTTVTEGPGGTTASRPYLAAFDVSTGSWIPSFTPTLDGPVYALEVSPDGQTLLVGGEFTAVDGAANSGGFVGLDPVTGARNATWSSSIVNTADVAVVLDIEIHGNDVYIGGDFTHVRAPDGTEVRKYNLARVVNGALDQTFDTRVTGGKLYAMSISPNGSALYLGGSFGNINASPDTNWFGAVTLPAGTAVLPNPNPLPFDRNRLVFDLFATDTHVWIGTESHFLFIHDATTLAEVARWQTKGFGGDTQAFFLDGNTMYVGGHAHGYLEKLRDPAPPPDRQIQWLTAFDATSLQPIDGHFPRLSMSDGIWALRRDSQGKLWVGGDPTRNQGLQAGGFVVYPLIGADDPIDIGRYQAVTQSSSGPTNMRWGNLNPNGTPKSPENSCPGIPVGAATGANDGKTAGGSRECSFSTTQTESDPWWEVDLGSVRDVDLLRIWNLQAGETDFITGEEWALGLSDVYVYLSDVPFIGDTLADMQAQPGVTIQQIPGVIDEFAELSSSREARYVRVQLVGASRTLRLAEVEVLDVPGDAPPADILLPFGSDWRYRDDGIISAGWDEPGFDDASWPVGPAQLGTGDGDESTVIANTSRGVYFRRTFQVPDPGVLVGLELDLIRDDGASVYINGTEVMREHLPATPLNPTTYATSAVWGSDERDPSTWALDPALLVPGTNTIAVEIHNASDGGDLSFDAELRNGTGGNTPPPPPPPPDPPGDDELIVFGDTWAYLDDGSNPAGWNQPGFDDATWASGPAELGARDGDEATVISNAFRGVYFRNSFSLADASEVTMLDLDLIRDDGAAVYINGTEVLRNNLPAGPLTPNTYATAAVWGAAESTPVSAALPVGVLVDGVNTVAVQVHNASQGGDLSFDLALTMSTEGEPPPPMNDPNPVPFGSVWSYSDNGAQPDPAWNQVGFDAGAWATGPAQLGANDGDEATVVNNVPRAVYFRRTFDVLDPVAVAALEIDLIRDDGAAVYVNGVEVVREHLPAGPLTVDTYATVAVWGSDERDPTTWSIDPALLVAGQNTIAVEIHNASQAGDLSFDLSLRLS